ncbi:MAG: hypothetical protein AAGK78_04995, partial [Planctomycetota bacterium]
MSSSPTDPQSDASANAELDLSPVPPSAISTDPIDDLPGGPDGTPYRELPQGQRLDIAEERVVLLTRKLEELTRLAKSLAEQVEHLGRLATLGTLSASLAHEFRNVLLVEQPNGPTTGGSAGRGGDFGITMARQWLFDTWYV